MAVISVSVSLSFLESRWHWHPQLFSATEWTFQLCNREHDSPVKSECWDAHLLHGRIPPSCLLEVHLHGYSWVLSWLYHLSLHPSRDRAASDQGPGHRTVLTGSSLGGPPMEANHQQRAVNFTGSGSAPTAQMAPLYRSGQQEVHQHYWPEERGVAARLVTSRSGRTSRPGDPRVATNQHSVVYVPAWHSTNGDVSLLTEQSRGGVRQL